MELQPFGAAKACLAVGRGRFTGVRGQGVGSSRICFSRNAARMEVNGTKCRSGHWLVVGCMKDGAPVPELFDLISLARSRPPDITLSIHVHAHESKTFQEIFCVSS
jgi:hypothetical protein